MKVFCVNEDSLEYSYDYNLIEKDLITNEIRRNESITIDDLRRIALWKYDRIINVDDDFLLELYNHISKSECSIYDSKTKQLIENLTSYDGVGYPLASTILKFINPDVFPIIDVRAYRALYGKKLYYSQYNLNVYIKYIEKLYEIKEFLKIPLTRVDEQLYIFDKIHNGKI